MTKSKRGLLFILTNIVKTETTAASIKHKKILHCRKTYNCLDEAEVLWVVAVFPLLHLT